jgi:hypothetical protein
MRQAFWRSKKDECSKARELLSGYMDQRLDPEEVALVEGHLGTCLGCREELESLRATVALLHRLPEVTPSRSFAVAPVKPLPGRRALPALRFATGAAVLLLVLALAADRTALFDSGMLSNPKAGPAVWDHGADIGTYEEGESYWVVSGLKNSIDSQPVKAAEVELVVPDGTDNVSAAVDSLATDGVVYGNIVSSSSEAPALVLMEGDSEAATRADAVQFTVVSDSGDTQNKFATNDAAVPSALDSIIEGQDGSYLNILSSDNNVLYSFDLKYSQREVKTSSESAWLRPLEYGLIGLAAILGGVTVALWLRQRRAKVVEASKSLN